MTNKNLTRRQQLFTAFKLLNDLHDFCHVFNIDLVTIIGHEQSIDIEGSGRPEWVAEAAEKFLIFSEDCQPDHIADIDFSAIEKHKEFYNPN